MASRKLIAIFEDCGKTEEMVGIFQKLSRYKAPIDLKTRRGNCILQTSLSVTTITMLFTEWEVKHRTEKKIVLKRK